MTEVEDFVPGPYIEVGEGVGRIRLRPPKHWPRFEIVIPRTPPSMNTDDIRSWRNFAKLKKEWQQEVMQLLMVAKVSRRGYQRAVAGCFMRFPVYGDVKRDPPNFAGLVTKAFADALVEYGALPDDDAHHYLFGGVEFEDDTGPRRTRIIVYFQPKEEG